MQTLAIDLGTKTCGFAISDASNSFAIPLKGLFFDKYRFDFVIKEIKELIKDRKISLIVLGFPTKEINTTLTPWQKKILSFKEKLEREIETKVVLFDESFTTKDSQKMMNEMEFSKREKQNSKDTMAATLLLENFLSFSNKKV